MSDENEQLDEIMALESIYGNDVFTCDVSNKPYMGQIVIHLQTDSRTFDILANGDSVTLMYLSPITLSFSLPSNYPSSSPPDFKLYCIWMTSDQLEMLSNRLRELWEENYNNVVLFTWVNFVQQEVLEFLDIKFPLNLSEENMMELIEHNAIKKQEAFNQLSYECPICFCEKPGAMFIELDNCGHVFCRDCLSGFLSVHITEGSVNALNCLAEKCDSQIFPHEIQSLVPQIEFERYDRLLLQNSLAIMKDITYCPRPKCCKPVVVDKDENLGMCHSCGFAFCVLCKLTYHGLEKCKEIEDEVEEEEVVLQHVRHQAIVTSVAEEPFKKQILRKDFVLRWNQIMKRDLARIYKGQQKKDYLKSEQFIKENCKYCPKCHVSIEKNHGCNQMTCNTCWTMFCWLCFAIFKDINEKMFHFKFPNDCKLFTT